MHLATHIIIVKGIFDKTWTKEFLKEYVNEKIKSKIFSTFHADLKYFNIFKNNIEIYVYVSCLPSEINRTIVFKWLKDNVTEKGLKVTWFGIETINCLFEPNDFGIMLE